MTVPTLYKATRPNATSFTCSPDGPVRWAVGEDTHHSMMRPNVHRRHASEYLSTSDAPADCTGARWPCRLFVVEPTDPPEAWRPDPEELPHKWAAGAFRVIEERPAWEALGPMGEHVADLLARLATLTTDQVAVIAAGAAAWDAARDAAVVAAWDAAWDAARAAAWAAARDAAGAAARDAARDAAWDAARTAAWAAARDAAGAAARDAAGAAARDAAMAAGGAAAWAAGGLVVRDLISTEHYDTLTRIVRQVLGPIHPDDPVLP